jgi:hypothetical protein
MAGLTTIIAIALCAICAFTFIVCIAMRASARSADPREEGLEQSIEIKVPAFISFQFHTKRCICPQQNENITIDPASNTTPIATPIPGTEPDTRTVPHPARYRHQGAAGTGTPPAVDGERGP